MPKLPKELPLEPNEGMTTAWSALNRLERRECDWGRAEGGGVGEATEDGPSRSEEVVRVGVGC
jgi:hypothetical protein